jgi:hypothetical protein
MNKAKVFVSYRDIAPDRLLARQIAAGLQPEHVVLIDTDIPPGQKWGELIQQRLEQSDFVVVILSEAAAASDMVVAEIETAHHL